MTMIQYVEHLLENNWESLVAGREEPVPKPEFYRESAQSLRMMNLDRSDAVLIRDGGATQYEPKSLGWKQEQQLARVSIDARTTGESGDVPGRERLLGYRGVGDLDPNEAERYGGLLGEIKRIFDSVRVGDQEFDLVRVTSQDDLSDQMGGQVWRGVTEVELDVRAQTINPVAYPGGGYGIDYGNHYGE